MKLFLLSLVFDTIISLLLLLLLLLLFHIYLKKKYVYKLQQLENLGFL